MAGLLENVILGDMSKIHAPKHSPGLSELPKSILLRVLSNCSYAEVTRWRLVSRAWRAACERTLNAAFFGLKERVEAHVRRSRQLLQQYASVDASPSPASGAAGAGGASAGPTGSSGPGAGAGAGPRPGEALLVARFVKLLTLQSELHLLHAVVARYVLRGRYAFAGGRVLDLARNALPDRPDDLDFDARDMSTLFFYSSLYLDHFERCVEPALAKDMGSLEERYGPKVVDLLCCSLCAGHQFVLAYDGTIVSVIGVFRVVERGASAPPQLPGRCDHDDARCTEVVRYLRGEIRWTNLTAVRDAARYGRAADVLQAAPAPAASGDAASPVDVLPAGLQRMLHDSLSGDALLYERLFRRPLLRPRMGEGLTVSLDLKCRRALMPALLRREIDAFDAARARDARAEEPERDRPAPASATRPPLGAAPAAAANPTASACALSSGAAQTHAHAHAPAPASAGAAAARARKDSSYEFAMLLRTRYYQAGRDAVVAAHPPELAILGTRLHILCLESPRRAGPLLQTQLSMYQARGLTALVPGPTKNLDGSLGSMRYVPHSQLSSLSPSLARTRRRLGDDDEDDDDFTPTPSSHATTPSALVLDLPDTELLFA